MIKPDDVIRTLVNAIEDGIVEEALTFAADYWFQDELEPGDIFTEAKLLAWAHSYGLTEAEDEDE